MFQVKGKIVFDPRDRTKKHGQQSSWKKIAIVQLDCDLHKYYAWFLQKRYNLILNKPIRGSHVTIVSDIINSKKWTESKKKYHGKILEFSYDPDTRTNGEYWWLRVQCEGAKNIRRTLGLSENPYWGLHLTIGYPNEKNIDHSFYIWGLLKKGLCI